MGVYVAWERFRPVGYPMRMCRPKGKSCSLRIRLDHSREGGTLRATEEWIRFVDSVNLHLNELAMEGCDLPFFRGHQDSAWTLLPG